MRARYLAGISTFLAVSVAYGGDLPNYEAYYQVAPRAVTSVTAPSHIPGHIVSRDDERGVPTFIWAHPRRVSKSPHKAPADAARWYLAQFADAYGLSKSALSTAYVSHVHDTGRGGIVVMMRQRVDGVEVVRNELKVLMTRGLDLTAVSGNLHDAALPGQPSFRLGAEDAVAHALGDMFQQSVDARSIRAAGTSTAGDGLYELAPQGIASGAHLVEPARVQRVLYPLPDRLVPGYRVQAISAASAGAETDGYAYIVSADDGRVLGRQDLVHDAAFQYRVWADDTAPHRPLDGPMANYTPHPTGIPDGSQPAFIDPILVSMDGFNTSPSGQPDPWLPDGATETVGNNAHAYADLVSPDGYNPGQDPRASVTADGIFDRVYDTSQSPGASADQIQAAIVQLFYTVNWLHDYFYDSGFTEAAGNAQNDNYGRGGAGGDAMRAEAQDYSGRNNANMMVPADGTAPRMQMYVWDGRSSLGISALGQSMSVGRANFGPSNFDLTAPLALANDGVSTPPAGTPTDGCEPIMNNVAGHIALIDRGTCGFVVKAKNAQLAGAVGVIIANLNASDPLPTMANSNPPEDITIPAFAISRTNGDALKAALELGPVPVTMHRVSEIQRDGTIDNHIIAHEWGHYIHRRLSNCYTKQCSAQSEGWGDFIALTLMVREGDDLHGVYAMSGYSTRVLGDSNYYGIRRVPYSVDRTRNALTLGHIADNATLPTFVHPMRTTASPNSQVHSAGEIFATILFEGYIALLEQSQGTSPRYSFDEARRRMADYIVAGMQFGPVDATYTEQLRAILAAAHAADIADYHVLAQAYARRGAGSCALSPPRDSQTFIGATDDFQLRGAFRLLEVTVDDSVLSCDGDGYLDGEETGRVTVAIENIGDAALSGTVIEVATANPYVSFPGGPSAVISTIDRFGTATATIDIAVAKALRQAGDLELDVTVQNGDACVTEDVTLAWRPINRDVGTAVTDSVESENTAWTLSVSDNEVWARSGEPEGNHLWHGEDLPFLSDQSLESPELLINPTEDFVISFMHRHSFEASTENGVTTWWDGGVIELSFDGGVTWEDIAGYVDPGYTGIITDQASNVLANRSAYSSTNPAWPERELVRLDLGTQLAGAGVRIRFRIGTDLGAGGYGWDIDDVHIQGLDNLPFIDLTRDRGRCTNDKPAASAGPDGEVQSGSPVTLDASASMDAEEDPLTFAWSQVTGAPAVDLADADRAVASFLAPEVSEPVVLSFSVAVSDGMDTVADTVDIRVTPRPVVEEPDAGADPEPDAGIPEPDAGDSPSDGDDGGCQASPRTPAGSGVLALLAMLAILCITRRRRA